MGNIFSSHQTHKETKQPKENVPQKEQNENKELKNEEQKPSQPARKAIDRSIFVQKNKSDETIVRTPGQINGNQFVVDQLERCKVIVTDFCDSMMIDRCNECEFVLSAVRGSIFCRNCSNCKFVIVCGQFRCRECNDCKFFMHVKTGPVIESSQNLQIGCANISYPELLEQMNKAKLDPVINLWSDIHDFTPGDNHFKLCPGEHLEMEIIPNSQENVLPFTFPPKTSGASYSVKLKADAIGTVAELSQNRIKIIGMSRGEDGTFSCELTAKSKDEATKLFTDNNVEPVSIKKLD
ncbi:protein XRP2 [Histomonas meleagridis]|uniref:protein XRP2 n=1 Tax=Histomonas meleagridis TaxID=135588 RepID=UPI003559BD67|nr:protein XRP2 [Histomonas meleagridis]KAH0801466.1 protein XRP2 [Histomonas meleagridis]